MRVRSEFTRRRRPRPAPRRDPSVDGHRVKDPRSRSGGDATTKASPTTPSAGNPGPAPGSTGEAPAPAQW